MNFQQAHKNKNVKRDKQKYLALNQFPTSSKRNGRRIITAINIIVMYMFLYCIGAVRDISYESVQSTAVFRPIASLLSTELQDETVHFPFGIIPIFILSLFK